MATKGYQPQTKLGTGARFANVQNQAAKGYIKKGYSPKNAAQIGAKIAAIAGRDAHGSKQMTKFAKAGK